MQVEVTLPEPVEVFIDPGDSLLVLVGMQNGTLKAKESALARRSDSLISVSITLLQKFRAAGGKVVFLQSVRKPGDLEITVFGHKPDALEGTWNAQIIDELVPEEGETVLKIWGRSPFIDLTLESFLVANDLLPCRSQVVVVGASANDLFDATVNGFRVRAFPVYVPVDGTVGATDQDEVVALRHLLGKMGRRQYNVVPTRSDLVTLDAERAPTDTLLSQMSFDGKVFDDPLYKAMTTLSVHD